MPWLYMPYPFAAESEALTSVSMPPIPEYAPFATLSGKPSPRPFSWHGWKNRFWIRRLYGTISKPSLARCFGKRWALSLEAFPVNHGQPLDQRQGSPTIGTCGRTCFESPSKPKPRPFSWKMFRALNRIQMDLPAFSATLGKWGGMHNGECFQMPPWEPPTGEKGSLCWPTPTASQTTPPGTTKRQGGTNLQTAAGMFATPTASQGGPRRGTSVTGKRPDGTKATISLAIQAKNFPTPKATRCSADEIRSGRPSMEQIAKMFPTPTASASGSNQGGGGGRTGPIRPPLSTLAPTFNTPKARDWKAPGDPSKTRLISELSDQAFGPQEMTLTNGMGSTIDYGPPRLNCHFVEKLMGFPIGYSDAIPIERTDYIVWETRFRRLLRAWLGQS